MQAFLDVLLLVSDQFQMYVNTQQLKEKNKKIKTVIEMAMNDFQTQQL